MITSARQRWSFPLCDFLWTVCRQSISFSNHHGRRTSRHARRIKKLSERHAIGGHSHRRLCLSDKTLWRPNGPEPLAVECVSRTATAGGAKAAASAQATNQNSVPIGRTGTALAFRACNKTPFGNCRMGVFWRIGKHWATTQDQSPNAAIHADTAKPSWFESHTASQLIYTSFRVRRRSKTRNRPGRVSGFLITRALRHRRDKTRKHPGGVAAEDEGRHVPLADSRRTTSRQVELPPLGGVPPLLRVTIAQCLQGASSCRFPATAFP
jgi:hypothetical protein